MEIIKLGTTPSRRVESYKEIRDLIPEFLAFLDDMNGSFEGEHDSAYALSHCQVSEDPLAVMVVAKEWTIEGAPADMPREALFRSRVMVNPCIVEVPSHTVKVLDVVDPLTQERGKEKGKIRNLVRVKEGCISFPHKKSKNMDRFYECVVEYQIPRSFLGIKYLKRVRETVKGLKAHIFQHECDHMEGENIFYGKRVR